MPRALAIGLFVMTLSGRAWALDEGDLQLSLAPAVAWLSSGDVGFGGRAEGRYGFTDAWSGWAAIGSSWHPLAVGGVRASSASAGATVAFDVLQTVPFVSLGAAFLDLGDARGGGWLGGELAVGGEYLADRHWSMALVARAQVFPVRLAGAGHPGLYGVAFQVGRTF